MGWNSWNKFLDKNRLANWSATTEANLLAQARALVDSGLAAAGYDTVVLDDGYQAVRRDYNGRMQSHPTRFRNGIAYLSEEIHKLGLKFGIYLVPGSLTCGQQYMDYHAENIGSLGYEETDAKTLAEWKVDFLKYDWCRAHLNDGLIAPETFRKMADALAEHAPDVIYSISEYGLFQSHLWAPEFANMWRTTDDLFADWDSLKKTIDLQVGLDPYSRPGHWNDPDMLQIGNGNLTDTENLTHMIIWSILSAPLFAGNDLETMSETTQKILTHPGLIRINQDWGGRQGRLISRTSGIQSWHKPMSDGSSALALTNEGDSKATIDIEKLDLPVNAWKDVWTDSTLASSTIELAPHASIMLLGR
jgi:hypothetical protein